MRLLLRKMARLGLVHQVVRDLFYTDTMIRRLAAMLVQLAAHNPVIQVTAFRDAVGLGRKRSIQILEYFDRIGLTRRFGDKRHIRLDNAWPNAPSTEFKEGNRARWRGRASNPVGDGIRSRAGSTPAAFRHFSFHLSNRVSSPKRS